MWSWLLLCAPGGGLVGRSDGAPLADSCILDVVPLLPPLTATASAVCEISIFARFLCSRLPEE